jgi:hypothetical protein
MIYKRKQIGRSSLLISIFSIVWAAIALSSTSLSALTTIAALGLLGLLFSSQTIEVDQSTVSWRFAARFWSCRIPRAEIAAVQEVSAKWWLGWGIRKLRGGWSYSVSGRKAVELTLKNGRRIILGTDRPRELAAALMAA